MADLKTFARRMARRAKQVDDGTDRIMQKTFIAVGSAVVPATPVDTGRARGAWLSSKGGNRGGEGIPDPSGNTAILANANVGVTMTANDVGVIANNVPYINKLNNGSSKQAPAGFVQKAIQAASRTVRSTRIFIN